MRIYWKNGFIKGSQNVAELRVSARGLQFPGVPLLYKCSYNQNWTHESYQFIVLSIREKAEITQSHSSLVSLNQNEGALPWRESWVNVIWNLRILDQMWLSFVELRSQDSCLFMSRDVNKVLQKALVILQFLGFIKLAHPPMEERSMVNSEGCVCVCVCVHMCACIYTLPHI